jgi:hypothetical protein
LLSFNLVRAFCPALFAPLLSVSLYFYFFPTYHSFPVVSCLPVSAQICSNARSFAVLTQTQAHTYSPYSLPKTESHHGNPIKMVTY